MTGVQTCALPISVIASDDTSPKGRGYALSKVGYSELYSDVRPCARWCLIIFMFAMIHVNSYSVELPDDYVLLLGDTAGIQPSDEYPNECWEKDNLGAYIVKYTDTLESTIETLDRQLSNSLSEHKLKYCQARPLKLIQDNNVILYTDGKYKVSEYELTYLAKPSEINSSNITNTEYTDLPEHTHMEIVKMAI